MARREVEVILLSPCATQGGAERGLVALARRLPEHGFRPRALLLESGPLEDWLEDVDCPVSVIDAGRLRQPARTRLALQEITREMGSAQAIIANQSKGHIYGGISAGRRSIPEIWWQQQHPTRNRIDVVAAMVPSSAVVCSSEASVAAQRRFTPRRPIVTIPLGTAIDKLADVQGTGLNIRRQLGWDQYPIIGIVGRLQEWKGQEVFLRSAALVASKMPRVRFAVIGGAILGWEGNYPDRLRSLCLELGILDQTYFAGHQSDVYPWFDALDVVVHASFGEPFDHVLIEAMALAKPLVATSKGGPANIVEDGISGIIVPAGDQTRMADAILHLLANPKKAAQMAEQAQQRASRFSDQMMAARWATLLSELIDSGNEGVGRS